MHETLTGGNNELFRHDVALSTIAIDHLQVNCGRVKPIGVTVARLRRQKLRQMKREKKIVYQRSYQYVNVRKRRLADFLPNEAQQRKQTED